HVDRFARGGNLDSAHLATGGPYRPGGAALGEVPSTTSAAAARQDRTESPPQDRLRPEDSPLHADPPLASFVCLRRIAADMRNLADVRPGGGGRTPRALPALGLRSTRSRLLLDEGVRPRLVRCSRTLVTGRGASAPSLERPAWRPAEPRLHRCLRRDRVRAARDVRLARGAGVFLWRRLHLPAPGAGAARLVARVPPARQARLVDLPAPVDRGVLLAPLPPGRARLHAVPPGGHRAAPRGQYPRAHNPAA